MAREKMKGQARLLKAMKPDGNRADLVEKLQLQGKDLAWRHVHTVQAIKVLRVIEAHAEKEEITVWVRIELGKLCKHLEACLQGPPRSMGGGK